MLRLAPAVHAVDGQRGRTYRRAPRRALARPYKKKKPSGGYVDTTMPGDSEIYVCTWNGGKLVNTWIYNNTFYIDSTGQTAGLISDCPGGGDAESGAMFRNNLVTSVIPNVLGDVSVLNNRARDYNLSWYSGGTFTDPNQEPHSIYYQNPLVNGFGYFRQTH